MGFYTLTIIKFSLGMLVMILQINILGKREFSLNTPLNQVQNYVLGGIIGGVIYNPSVTVLQFLIVLLIWSLVIVAAKLLFGSSGTLRRAIACQPELLVCDGKVDIARCAKVGLTAEQLSGSLREKGIPSVADVEAAVMETDGRLTIRVAGTRDGSPLLPLVSDGHLVRDGLKLAGRDETWVTERLREQGYDSVRRFRSRTRHVRWPSSHRHHAGPIHMTDGPRKKRVAFAPWRSCFRKSPASPQVRADR